MVKKLEKVSKALNKASKLHKKQSKILKKHIKEMKRGRANLVFGTSFDVDNVSGILLLFIVI